MSWYLNSDNILENNQLPEVIDGDIFRVPYPVTFWQMSIQNVLFNGALPDVIDSPILRKPYPASLWYLEPELDNVLMNSLLPEELMPPVEAGAFYNATKLEYVRIPRSVTSIGWSAFKGTKLKEVCLSRNCQFDVDAFPKDCRIIFYEDMYDINYNIQVGGVNSYRTTEYITHDEDSWDSEIP